MKNVFPVFLPLIALLSCTVQEPRGVKFDTEKFNKQKEIWKKSDIKSYSFQYGLDDYMPDYVLVTVEVENDNSKVNIDSIDAQENPTDEQKADSPDYIKTYIEKIKSIDSLFDILDSEYQQALKEVDERTYDYITFQCRYNSTYDYPEYISISKECEGDDVKYNGVDGHRSTTFLFNLKSLDS